MGVPIPLSHQRIVTICWKEWKEKEEKEGELHFNLVRGAMLKALMSHDNPGTDWHRQQPEVSKNSNMELTCARLGPKSSLSTHSFSLLENRNTSVLLPFSSQPL